MYYIFILWFLNVFFYFINIFYVGEKYEIPNNGSRYKGKNICYFQKGQHFELSYKNQNDITG